MKMMKSGPAIAGLLASSLVIVSLFAASALAQGKAGGTLVAETKVLLENDKVQVTETHYKPGAENANVPRNARVVRALTTGTLERTYPDGKKERIEWKSGQVRFNPAVEGQSPQYVTKNVGKGDLVLYLVILK